MIRRVLLVLASLVVAVCVVASVGQQHLRAAASLPTPEQFAGHRIGDDNKLVRWDKIVEYMTLVSKASDRVHLRELGKTTDGAPFIALEISAPDTLKDLDRYKAL